MPLLTELHRKRQDQGRRVITPDWNSGLVEVEDPTGTALDSVVVSADGRVVDITHNAVTTDLAQNNVQRTGCAVLFPIDLGRPLDFRRDLLSVEGEVLIDVADGRQVGEAGTLVLTEQFAVGAGPTDYWAYSGYRLAQEGGGVRAAGVTASDHDPVALITTTGQGQHGTVHIQGMRSDGNPDLTRGLYAYSSDSSDEADRGVRGAEFNAFNQSSWHGGADPSRVYVALWVDTDGQAVGAGFTVRFQNVRVIHQDRYAGLGWS